MTRVKQRNLDPRKSRKLTDRECSVVLGGVLGAISTSKIVSLEESREALRMWAESDVLWEPIRGQAARTHKDVNDDIEAARLDDAGSLPSGLRMAYRALGGSIAGLCSVSSERVVRRAVEWWFYNENAWIVPEDPKNRIADRTRTLRSSR